MMIFKQHNAEQKKLFLLIGAVFLVATAYALLRPLKTSVFCPIVGREWLAYSKFIMAFLVIPCMAVYSKIVDTYQKHIVLYIFFAIYVCLGIAFAIFFSHPTIGLSNTQASPYRLIGWLFLAAMDFFPAFVIGTLWAFINSCSTTQFAKQDYGKLIASTKVGGFIASLIGLWLLHKQDDPTLVCGLILGASGFVLIAIFFIAYIVWKIPRENLVGYQETHVPQPQKASKNSLTSLIDGLRTFIVAPYVFGIFLLFYCYDVIFTIVEYEAHYLLSLAKSSSATQMGETLYLVALISNAIGFFLAFLVKPFLVRINKMSVALMVMPVLAIVQIITLLLFPSLSMALIAITVLPTINFGFNSPVREMLFIPTVKDIQFKSKAWIDSFGRTLAKSSGSGVNIFFSAAQASSFAFVGNLLACLGFGSILMVAAYFMGRAYNKTIDTQTIIDGK